MNDRQIEQHVPILGWLYVISSGFFLLLGFCILLLLFGIGVAVATDDPSALPVLTVVGLFSGGIMALMGLPGIIAGWGLLRRKNWARILTLIVSALNLFNVPLGTALGLYSFFVLLQPEATAYFGGEKAIVTP